MWNLNKLIIENILSFEKETVVFKNNKLTLIQGINNTDTGAKSNGSGKSTILECIKLALTTNTIKKINKVDIIRNSESVNEGYLELELINSVTNEVFVIKKYLSRKKSNKCELFENGVRIDRLVDLNINESDKYILSKIGLTVDELDNYFLISKEKYTSFFNSSDRSKKELVNQFSKTDKLDKIPDLLKTDYSSFEATKKQYQTNQEILRSKQSVLRNQIDKLDGDRLTILSSIDSVNQLIKETSEKLDLKNKDLLKYDQSKISDYDIIFNQISEEKKLLETNLLNQKELDLSSFKQKQSQLTSKSKELKDDLNLLDQNINKSNIDLKSTINCPKCKYEFIITDSTKNVEEIKQNLKECLELKQELAITQFTLGNELNDIDKQIREINNKDYLNVDQINELKLQLSLVQEEKQQYRIQLTSIQSEVNSLSNINQQYLKQLEQLQNSFAQQKEQELNKEIEQYELEVLSIDKQLSDVDILINELSTVEHTLNSFRTVLANNSLQYIEQKANEFMEKIKCSYKILISGYKLLSTGKIKDEISISVTRDGVNEESFGKFSSGERAKADISCILALNEIINYNVSPNGLNLILVDEVLESVDESGFLNIVESLDSLNKTILLITHVSPDVIHNVNKIVVEKNNNVSKILN